jgi:hypothetical protein
MSIEVFFLEDGAISSQLMGGVFVGRRISRPTDRSVRWLNLKRDANSRCHRESRFHANTRDANRNHVCAFWSRLFHPSKYSRLLSILNTLEIVAPGCLARVDSHIRSTAHPFEFSSRVTRRSLRRFLSIFADQYSEFVSGADFLLGCPCQKSPSTKTASRTLGNAKSGFPTSVEFRLQPVIPCLRSRSRKAISVVLLPFERMRLII